MITLNNDSYNHDSQNEVVWKKDFCRMNKLHNRSDFYILLSNVFINAMCMKLKIKVQEIERILYRNKSFY